MQIVRCLAAALALLALASPTHAEERGNRETIEYACLSLGWGSESSRYQAAVELGKMGEVAWRAAGHLTRALSDPSPGVRYAVENAIELIGPKSVPIVARVLDSSNVVHRRNAARVLLKFGAGSASFLRRIIKQLDDPDAEVRDACADTIGKIGAEKAIAPLRALLKSRNPETRIAAGRALGQMGERSLPALLAAITNEKHPGRDGAARGLGFLGSAGENASGALLELFRDKDLPEGLHMEIAVALARIEWRTDLLLNSFLPALASESSHARNAAVRGLILLGEESLEPMGEALSDDARQDGAIAVLFGLGAPGRKVIVSALGSSDINVRYAALLVLDNPYTVPTANRLKTALAMLDDPDPERRRVVLKMFDRPGAEGSATLEKALADRLEDPDGQCRATAVLALGRVGVSMPGLLDKLALLAKSDDPFTRVTASYVCLLNGRESNAGIAAIKSVLTNAKAPTEARALAAMVLGRVGGPAHVTVKALLAATKTKEPVLLRREATGALVALIRVSGVGVIERRARWRRTSAGAKKLVKPALAWLASQQKAEGHWAPEELGGRSSHTVGVTGLALQAFLSAGHTPTDPKSAYAKTLRIGLDSLIKRQRASGFIGISGRSRGRTNHAVATVALVEAWMLTWDPDYRQPAERAIGYIARAANKRAWGYDYGKGKSNMDSTVWSAMAIRLGAHGGLRVDTAPLARANNWVLSMRALGEDGNTFGYSRRAGPVFRPRELAHKFPAQYSRSSTAAGVWTRFLSTGHIYVYGTQDFVSFLRAGSDWVLDRGDLDWTKRPGRVDLYFWQFSTLVEAQGEPRWGLRSHKLLIKVLARYQKLKGEHRGSWDPVGIWGSEGGRVYTTAMAVLGLTGPARFARNFLRAPVYGAPYRSVLKAFRSLAIDKDKIVREHARSMVLED